MRKGAQRPRLHSHPWLGTQEADGDDAIEYAEKELGYILDDWQKFCIRGILANDDNYNLCVNIAVLILPRQNGKNVVLEVIELYMFYVLDVPVIVHSAHRQDTSADHMLRLRNIIENTPALDAITEIYEANGKERIHRTDNGADIRFVTRSNKIGRGRSPRVVIFDEALYLTAAQIQAIIPSLSAQSMRDDAPILIYTSSAPLPESRILHNTRKMVKDGGNRIWYAEWGNEPGVDPDDRDALYDANPGMGTRISEEWVYSIERKLLDLDGFLAERMGVPYGGEEDDEDKLMANWPECADITSEFSDDYPIEFAVDVRPGGKSTSFMVCGVREDGVPQVEIVAYMQGTGPDVINKIKRNTDAVYIEPRSETASLIQDLTKAGVEVHTLGTLEYLQACQSWKRAVDNKRIKHRDETPLNQAVAGATVRVNSDGWVWARRTATVDISPLVAGSIALWAVGEDADSEEGDTNLW